LILGCLRGINARRTRLIVPRAHALHAYVTAVELESRRVRGRRREGGPSPLRPGGAAPARQFAPTNYGKSQVTNYEKISGGETRTRPQVSTRLRSTRE